MLSTDLNFITNKSLHGRITAAFGISEIVFFDYSSCIKPILITAVLFYRSAIQQHLM